MVNTLQMISNGIACLWLLAFCTTARGESFSIKCEYLNGFFISFDLDSGRVVEETLSGRGLKGLVDKADGSTIRFRILRAGEPAINLAFERRTGQLESPASNDSRNDRGEQRMHCVPTNLRPILSEYDNLWP